MGASKKFKINESTVSQTPILLGLTAKTSGVGNSFPKQNIMFFAAFIFGFISPPSSELVCLYWSKIAINAKTGWASIFVERLLFHLHS